MGHRLVENYLALITLTPALLDHRGCPTHTYARVRTIENTAAVAVPAAADAA